MKNRRRIPNKKQIVVVLDNIRSRFNVGAIFRTADAAGVSHLFLCGITPCPPHPKINKVALGAEKTVPWSKHSFTWRVLKTLKSEGYFLIALEQGEKSQDIFQFKLPAGINKIALILGSETKGLSSKILSRVNKQIEIPMLGAKESLNVAVAFGIAIYSLLFLSYNKSKRL